MTQVTQTVKTIRLTMPLKLGSVNCYLVQGSTGFALIDTGVSSRRADLDREIESAGCGPGCLQLIVLTHGDFDHSGNAAYLRAKHGARIAMHRDDVGMVERGDMFWNRKKTNIVIRMLAPLLFGFGRSGRFSPDLHVGDGSDLSEYGFEAQVVHIPGHSQGSIGVLTAAGDLFCGDLLENTDKPALGSLVDDHAAMQASVEQLGRLGIGTVYPGHGRPFPMELLPEVG